MKKFFNDRVKRAFNTKNQKKYVYSNNIFRKISMNCFNSVIKYGNLVNYINYKDILVPIKK